MKYNFSDSVRLALAMAREESLRLRHDYVGTEHILLGLARLDGFLDDFGLDAGTLADQVAASVRPGSSTIPRGELPYTSRAKKVLELAMAEAREQRSKFIGPAHILLGVLREEEGIGARVLVSLGLGIEHARLVATRVAALTGDPVEPTAVRGKLRWNRDADAVRRSALTKATLLGHDYIGTEHLLLVLSGDEELMRRVGSSGMPVSRRIHRVIPPRGQRSTEARKLLEIEPSLPLPFTQPAVKALKHAMKEAKTAGWSGHGDADVAFLPEHLLLGLLREEGGTAYHVLASLGLDLESAREVLGESTPPAGKRGASAAEGFPITLDDESESSSIYQQIVDRIREGVATGALTPGKRLRPVRRLADQLDIAPGTVARAYAELERLGVVVTEGARGTRIAEPKREESPPSERLDTLAGLLRPVAVATFHMGGSAAELRSALEAAMKGILDEGADAA